MTTASGAPVPSHHTPDGGVLVGSVEAPHRLVLFEDPQCPYCRQFEEDCGEVIRSGVAGGDIAVEYRMRCFLGEESVRADNALALAAEEGRFDPLRQALFASQPPEQSGGFTVGDLIGLGHGVGLAGTRYEQGVREGRYLHWVVEIDEVFQRQDPEGTPAGLLDGLRVPPRTLLDPAAFGRLTGR